MKEDKIAKEETIGEVVPLTDLVKKIHLHMTYHPWGDYDSRVEMSAFKIDEANGFRRRHLRKYETVIFDRTYETEKTEDGLYVLREQTAEKIRESLTHLGISREFSDRTIKAGITPIKVGEHKTKLHELVIGMGTYSLLPLHRGDKTILIDKYLLIEKSIPTEFYKGEEAREILTLKDIMAKDSERTATIYLGKLDAYGAMPEEMDKIAMRLKDIDFKVVGEYCKCAKDERIKRAERVMPLELVKCGFDKGFYDAIGMSLEEVLKGEHTIEKRW